MAGTGLDIKDVVVMKTGRIPAESNEGVWSHMGHACEPGPVASPCNPGSHAYSSPEPLVTPQEALLGPGFFFFFLIYLKIKKNFIMDVRRFKSLYEFGITWLLFSALVFWPQGMWDLRSLTRDQTQAPCLGSVAP